MQVQGAKAAAVPPPVLQAAGWRRASRARLPPPVSATACPSCMRQGGLSAGSTVCAASHAPPIHLPLQLLLP